MQILGVSGGIASGKSTYCAHFRALGIPVIDADLLARQAALPDGPAYQALVQLLLPLLGPDSLFLPPHDNHHPRRHLDRLAIARFIFNPQNVRIKRRVEAILHPIVIRRILASLFWCFLSRCDRVVIEVPLLFETGLHRLCSKTLLIVCPAQVQLQRLLARNPELSPVDVERRLASQLSIDVKRSLADFVIDNSVHVSDVLTDPDSLIRRQCVDFLRENFVAKPGQSLLIWSLFVLSFSAVAVYLSSKFLVACGYNVLPSALPFS